MVEIGAEREETEWNQEALRLQVFEIVRAVPVGSTLSYGEVGARCDPPISGYIVGRIIAGTPGDVPWWRIVGKDGALPIRKRNPHLAVEQRQRLEDEGVSFDENGLVAGSS
jgi:methylated-DNA-protein-cysteine methyltransferase-like protein